MAIGARVCLPEHLDDGDARSWFKRYELCVAANEWNTAKKLLRLPVLSKAGHGPYLNHWATMRRTRMPTAMTERLNPDTDKNRMGARKQLMLRRFREGVESVDELA